MRRARRTDPGHQTIRRDHRVDRAHRACAACRGIPVGGAQFRTQDRRRRAAHGDGLGRGQGDLHGHRGVIRCAARRLRPGHAGDPRAHCLLRRLPGAVRHHVRAQRGRNRRHHRRQRRRQIHFPQSRSSGCCRGRPAPCASTAATSARCPPTKSSSSASRWCRKAGGCFHRCRSRKICWSALTAGTPADRGISTAIYQLFPVLRERRHTPSTALSGGQQQMVAIGRSLMSNPRILSMRRTQSRTRSDRDPRHLRGARRHQDARHQRRAGRAGPRPRHVGRRPGLLLSGRAA